MRRHWPLLAFVLSFAMLATPASGQQAGIRWQQDLEAAKTLARQSGRLVLVHFWTPECAPCVTLEQQVFNQPTVASAIESQFVPVKLDANLNSATAQGFGITRVPTDVIITPDGAVVGKLVSPPTPGAYLAEVTQVAAGHRATLGAPFARAAAAAPAPSQINPAYANLAISSTAQPVIAQPVASQATPSPSGMTAQLQPSPVVAPPIAPLGADRAASPPLSVNNQYTASPSPQSAQSPFAPPPNPTFGAPEIPPASSPVAIAPSTTPALPTAAPQPVSPSVSPSLAASTLVPAVPFAAQAPAPVAAQPGTETTATGVAPDPKQLPAGAPPLGFDGYCPVSMRNNWKWVAGDPRWGVVHRGRTYWFASQSEQQQFWTDPDRFSPALSGMDPVMAIDHKQQVPGKREHSIDYDNLFYMFCSEATLQQFTANPERYAVGVREAMGIPRGRLVR